MNAKKPAVKIRAAAKAPNASVTPPLAEPSPDQPVRVLIPKAVQDAWIAADPYSVRYALQGVWVARDPKGNVEVCGTDSRRLHAYQWNDGTANRPFKTLVPRDQFRYAAEVRPEFTPSTKEYGYQDQWNGTVFYEKRKNKPVSEEYKIEGRFPKWKSVSHPPLVSSAARQLDLIGLPEAWSTYFRETTKRKLSALFDGPRTPADQQVDRSHIRTLLPFDNDRCYELPVIIYPGTRYFRGRDTDSEHTYQLGILRRTADWGYVFDVDPEPGIFNRKAWEARMGSAEPMSYDEDDQRDPSQWGESKMNHVELNLNFLFDVANAFRSLGTKIRLFPNTDDPTKSVAFQNANGNRLSLLSIVMPIAPDN